MALSFSSKFQCSNLNTVLPSKWPVVRVNHMYTHRGSNCGTKQRPKWINNHQCTSWPLCPLDGVAFFHSASDGAHHSRFLFAADLFSFFLFLAVFPRPDLTHSYPAHFPTLISIALLHQPTDTATLITSYPIDLAIVLTTYPTNLATLLITYPTNLTIRFRVETQIN